MANQKGLVVESANGWARVVTERRDACGACSSVHNCRVCLTNSKMISKVQDPVGARAGDMVIVSLNSGVLLAGAAIVYLLPVAGLILGAAAGSWMSSYLALGETLLSAIFGLGGLGIAFLISTFICKAAFIRHRLRPVITKIVLPSLRASQGPGVISA